MREIKVVGYVIRERNLGFELRGREIERPKLGVRGLERERERERGSGG